jgi:bacterioferritin-associated ferredoxin
MIVCLCHRVSDRDIRRVVAAGVRNFEVLQDETRVASACGCCHDCAREVFNEACGPDSCPGLCHGEAPALQPIHLQRA